jgi:hypothetical protein
MRGGLTMIFSLRRMIEWIKLLILFILLSFVFYHLISWMVVWIQPIDPYREPMGRAIKVFHYDDASSTVGEWHWIDRLKFFYWFGE